ncbi:MAG: iron chelate uptake ABC transporter family permease subunit [Saprospiraceae bacterium]|jgi:ABC-type Mn2+/Zn2+ transport system permease subunit/Mn-dependent DtxR family transcriptional regulator|nr:iron chelate uptake ABC transporter family permease subunit [Saprospiraceae bacterium]
MIEILQHFQEAWAIRALLASSMVGLMCGVLGSFIVLRNMALIGDALAHAILPGVVVAFLIVGHSTLGFFVGSVVAGLIAAIGITWVQQNVKTKNDAAIGIVFTAMFAIGVIGISKISRQPGVHLDLVDFLFGNVLGVSNEDLYLTFGVMIFVFLSVIVFYRQLFVATFQPVIAETMGISVKTIHYFLMLLLSFAVVASLRTVGLILVVAMLITPAATALLLSNRLHKVVIFSGVIGLFSAIIGLVVAIQLDLTPGPAMAVVATLFYIVAAFFSPTKGLVFKYFRKRALKHRIQLEDILKQSFRLQQREELNLTNLLSRLGFKKSILRMHLSTLRSQNLVEADSLKLTKNGQKEARRLVRAHRLWETYLVNKVGLTAEQIHEDAEKYEHLLTDEILDEVDATLGYPTQDPHGSPIPKKTNFPDFPLVNLEILQKAKITGQQINEQIVFKLWELGLVPETTFSIQRKESDFLEIQQGEKQVKLPIELAKQVNIIV